MEYILVQTRKDTVRNRQRCFYWNCDTAQFDRNPHNATPYHSQYVLECIAREYLNQVCNAISALEAAGFPTEFSIVPVYTAEEVET